jgi:hypothetical protein
MFRFTSTELLAMAKQAGQGVEAFLKAIGTYDEFQNGIHNARCSTPEEKVQIEKYLAGLNGSFSEDLTVSDILSGAKVRVNQGTKSFATRSFKAALLTHQQA